MKQTFHILNFSVPIQQYQPAEFCQRFRLNVPSVTLTPCGTADTQLLAGNMLDSFCSNGSCVHPGALSRVYRCDSPPHPVLE